eukprot:scaffold9181_cov37-Tisochrysis_lutea.AAC.2
MPHLLFATNVGGQGPYTACFCCTRETTAARARRGVTLRPPPVKPCKQSSTEEEHGLRVHPSSAPPTAPHFLSLRRTTLACRQEDIVVHRESDVRCAREGPRSRVLMRTNAYRRTNA